MPANPRTAIARSRRAVVSRRNGRLSRGPVTDAGRSAASANSLLHGLYSGRLILPTENPAEFAGLEAEFAAEVSPGIAHTLAAATWRLRRIDRLDATLTDSAILSDRAVFRFFNALSRFDAIESNRIEKALLIRTKSESILQHQKQFQRDSRNLGSFPQI